MKSYFNSSNCLSFTLALFLLVSAFSSCQKDNNNNTISVAGVVVTNAAPLLDSQDVYFDGQKANGLTAITYTKTLGYFGVTGSPTISFKNTNTGALSASTGTDFVPGKYYSVFLTNDRSINIYDIDRSAVPTGKTRIRFINLTTALGSNVDIGYNGGAKIINALTYKSASAYQTVDATSRFSLYAGGSSSVSLDLPTSLQSTAVCSVYISGATSATLTYKLIIEN